MSPERTLREYIQIQLSSAGFAVDEDAEGIKAWPRGRDPGAATFVIGERKSTYVVIKGEGKFTRRKIQSAMNGYLQNWVNMYNMGARY